jgi:hypothetical protein
MAAREKIWNFEMNFGGVTSYIIWHTKVVVVCKVELVGKISKSAQSRI